MNWIKGAALAAMLILPGCNEQGYQRHDASEQGWSRCGEPVTLEATAPDGTKLWHDPCDYDVYFASNFATHEYRVGRQTRHNYVGTAHERLQARMES